MRHAQPASDTVPAMLARRAASTPLGVAFRHEINAGQWTDVTWQSFASQVATVANALGAAGLRQGDRLALIAPVSLRWECLHHAALAMGVVVIGMDGHDLPDRIAAMVELSDVTAIACASAPAIAGIAHDRLAACRLRLRLDAVATDAAFGAGWLSWEDLGGMVPTAAATVATAAGAATPTAPTGSDLATVIFTSGTTGAPKGIGYSHSQVCLAVAAICDAFSFAGTNSRVLCWLPLSNLFQRMVNLAALQQGASTFLLDDPRRVMDVVAQVSPDVFVGVPRFFEKLHAGLLNGLSKQPPWQRRLVAWAWQVGRQAKALERAKRPLPLALGMAHHVADRWVLRSVRAVMGSRLQCMVSGSAPMPRQLLEELHGLGWLVLEAYGLSENILPMAMNSVVAHRFGTVGKPVPGNDIHIGGDGAILVRGPGLFSGYLGEAPVAVLDQDGYFRTGDLGHFDADGFLVLTGRSGDLIKTSTGRRVAPAGIEAGLRAVPGIDHALVAGAGRKCLIALCTCTVDLQNPAQFDALTQALRTHLAGLGENDRPRAVGLLQAPFSIDQGELTPNLKMRREVIAERHAALVDALYAAIDTRVSPHPGIVLIP